MDTTRTSATLRTPIPRSLKASALVIGLGSFLIGLYLAVLNVVGSVNVQVVSLMFTSHSNTLSTFIGEALGNSVVFPIVLAGVICLYPFSNRKAAFLHLFSIFTVVWTLLAIYTTIM